MSWKVVAVLVAVFGSSLCMSDVHKQCVQTFNEDLSNDFLHGTWYHVMKFTLFSSMVPTSQCPTSVIQKANSSEVERYRNEYWTPDIPYSFEDNPIEELGSPLKPGALVIGNKQAKFLILDPKTAFFRPLYDVNIYQRLSDDFVLFHDCNLRGNLRWMLSKKRNPTDAELQAIIQTRPDIVRMDQQRFCWSN